MSVLALVLSLSSAHAAGGCLASFSANLSRISGAVSRLSPKCWSEVEKGEGNIDRITATCSESELHIVMTIRGYRDANRSLCNSECRPELDSVRVCVGGRKLKYYINQARHR